MFLCLCCRVRCSALGSLAALKLPEAETPLIGCSFSGAREGEPEQSCARSHDCDKLHSAVAALGICSGRQLNGTRR